MKGEAKEGKKGSTKAKQVFSLLNPLL